MSTAIATKVVTGKKTRLSYAHLFEPWSGGNQGETAKYQTTLLIPKDDTETINKIKAAIKAAAEAGLTTKFGGRMPSPLKHTLRDGDTDDAAFEKDGTTPKEGYPGHLFMRVSSNTKPGVVDANLNPILDTTEVYSGCYARVSIGAYAYNTNGNKGVTFGLNNVMKVADGDSLGGRARAEDDFSEFAGAGAGASDPADSGSGADVELDLI